ncbi:MAG: hypothetical protein QW667_01405 [Candidatus Bathyarchaeia archaeon]
MYNELYEVWKQEIENKEPVRLPPDFYVKVTNYIKRIREESRMLDKKTVRAILLKKEMENVQRMLSELVRTRYRKLMRKAAKGEKIPPDTLTAEEEKIFKNLPSIAENYQNFVKAILMGQTYDLEKEQKHRRVVIRVLKDIPSIVGADMKTYGPYKVEDVASLPAENAKILIKQGLAAKVETP